jgi:predicted RecA/RadA family phage recombinase
MMTKYVQAGKIINYTNLSVSDIAYGDVVVLSGRIGVASCPIPVGATGTVALEEVYEMPAETTAAFAVGQKLYWDSTNKRLTATAGDVYAGIATEVKAAAGSVATVKM